MKLMWNGYRPVGVNDNGVEEALMNGLIPYDKFKREGLLHEELFMAHKNVPGILTVNGTQIEDMKAKGYFETDKDGNPLEYVKPGPAKEEKKKEKKKKDKGEPVEEKEELVA